MTQNEWFSAGFIVFFLITTLCFRYFTNYWKNQAKEARAEAAAYLVLLGAQRELVEGVLALNDTMLQERVAIYRLQEEQFVTHTGVGQIH